MLVLSRRNHEEIQIGDDIRLVVLKVRGNAVQLGIDAPRSVRVIRSELGRQKALAPVASPFRRGAP